MANIALLKIGTSTTSIDLLNTAGFLLLDWIPQGGNHEAQFSDSSFADGRQAASSRDLNVIETFELSLRGHDVDDAAGKVQDLRRMLRAALAYWTSHDPSLPPVYLTARSSCETNSRYALIYDARLPEDENYYDSPFLQPLGGAVMQNLTMIVERGPWLETPPGTGTCVQVEGTQLTNYTETTVTASPAASADDVCNYVGQTSLNVASTQLPLGLDVNDSARLGIRFTALNVPQGSNILRAYVTFEATADGSGSASVLIFGQAANDTATFSDFADFKARLSSPTSAQVSWNFSVWTSGAFYNTPDLTSVVQTIISRPGWVANNDLTLFFVDNGSTNPGYGMAGSWDHATAAAPILTVVYAAELEAGRGPTCTDEVYLANKQNQAQITHAFINDGGAYSANLIGAALPVDLLPAVPADADEVYFGIMSSLVNSGPFSNLVFDIDDTAAYTGAARMDWFYYNGGWVALTVQDNTGSPHTFSVAGVNSVHWQQPSDWTTVAVNGITAYWVKAVCTIPGGDSIRMPTQQNRNIYTVDWPRVDIDEAQVGGDLPALAQIKLQNWSDAAYNASPTLWSTRVLYGLRNMERGEDFTAFINLADEQNPAGITVTAYNDTTIANNTRAPSGRVAYFNSTGAGTSTSMLSRVGVTLENTIAGQYLGRYRVYIRGIQATGGTVGNVGVQLYHYSGGAVQYSATQYFTALNVFQALDMGIITIPAGLYQTSDTFYGDIDLVVRAQSTAAADDAYFTDLILIPIDEGSGEFLWSGVLNSGYNGQPGSDHTLLDIDSITYPKANLRATVREASSGAVMASYETRCSGPAVLLNNVDQRLWLFSQRNLVSAPTIWYAEPEIAYSIQVYRQQRYETLRGAG